MGRAKLKMELIAKKKSRQSTYFQRKKGLLKKLEEFETLCGVETLMILFGPEQGDRPVEVETYPKELPKVHKIIERYQKVPEGDKAKRTLTLKNFFEDQTKKLQAELAKQREKNQELDDKVTVDQIDVKISEIEQRIRSMKGMNTGGVMDGSKTIAEFPNAVVPDLIPYYPSNTYSNHDDQTMWRREEMMHTPPYSYPVPLPPEKDYTIDYENQHMGYPNYGYQFYWDGNSYPNQHMSMSPAIMSSASMYQMQHQLPYTDNQHQFMSSGSSSQMHQQPSKSHFGFHEDQTNN